MSLKAPSHYNNYPHEEVDHVAVDSKEPLHLTLGPTRHYHGHHAVLRWKEMGNGKSVAIIGHFACSSPLCRLREKDITFDTL